MTDMLDRVETAKPQESEPKAEKKASRIRLLTRGALEKVGITPTRKRENLTMGGVGGGATAGALAAILALTSPAGTPAPEETSVAVVDEKPGEEEPVVEENPGTNGETGNDTLGTITIEAGQTDEQAALDIQTQLSNWKVAGSDGFIDAWTQEAIKTGDAGNDAYNAFVKAYALEQSKPYLVELFGVQSVEEIQDEATRTYVTGTMTILEQNLYLTLRTDGRYEVETQLTGSSAVPNGDGRTFTLNTEIVSNDAESGAAGVIRENNWVNSTGEKAVVTASTWIDSESERISSISIELAN